MNMNRYSKLPDSFPDPLQEIFLKAALGDRNEALESWRVWKAKVDIEDVDFATFRLLPILYKNLKKHQIEDPLMDKLKGIYRYNWAKNQMLIYATTSILRDLKAKKIPTLLLKGLPLALLAYRDVGCRFMSDVDMLVPPDRAVDAIKIMIEKGWMPKFQGFIRPDSNWAKEYIKRRPSCPFSNASGIELDLHWLVTHDSFDPNINNGFWKESIPLELDNETTNTLNPADMLVHVCTHGARWNISPPFRWVADAIMILRKWDNLDWERVIKQTERLKVTLPMRDTLSYLNIKFKAEIPEDILYSLFQKQVSKWEAREYFLSSNKTNLYKNLHIYWYWFTRLKNSSSENFSMVSFPRFYQYLAGLENFYQLPGYIIMKLLRKTWLRNS